MDPLAVGLSAGERDVCDAARSADRFQIKAFFESLELIPESFSAAQDYGGNHNGMSSIRSAARKLRTVDGPPPMRTSSSPAASLAILRASAGMASMKWNVVPPFISIVDLGL